MSRREDRVRARLDRFLREYGRTSRRRGLDPNDRHYDRRFEEEVKRLDPRDLDQFHRGDGEADTEADQQMNGA